MLLMFWSTEISGRYRLHLSILFLLSHIFPLLGKGLPTIPLTSPSNLSRRRESYGTTENQRCSRTASTDAATKWWPILSHIVLIGIYLRIYTNIIQNYWFSFIFYSILIEILNNMIIIIQSFHSNSFINIKNILECKILLLTTRVTSSSERVKGL